MSSQGQGFVFEMRFKDGRGARQGLTRAVSSEELIKRLRRNNEGIQSLTIKQVGDKPVSFPLDWSKL